MSHSIFISYSHKDKEWLNALQKFLKPALRNDFSFNEKDIILWSDKEINPGDEWQEKIDNALASAKIAILLVSQDFLNSDFIAEKELPVILEAVHTKRLVCSWIHLSASTYSKSSFEKYQALSNPQIPLARLPKERRNEEWVNISERIVKLIKGEAIDPFEFIPQSEHKTIAESGSSAKEGMEAFAKLAENPNVRRSIVQFKGKFRTSCEQIVRLGFYKLLHDGLHTLQFQCYRLVMNIVRQVRINPANSLVWRDAVQYELDLQKIVDGLNESTNEARLIEETHGMESVITELIADVTWVPSLVANLQALSRSIRNKNVEVIDTTLPEIRLVLALQSNKLNRSLIKASHNLELPTLISVLNEAQNNLDTTLNPAIVNEFKNGIDALQDLDVKLTLLRDEHDKWETTAAEIRRIEGMMIKDSSELKNGWIFLKSLTEEICLNNKEEWALSIMKSIGNLDKSLLTDNEEIIQDDFLRFRSLTSDRFYKVDLTLKELCGKLREIGKPLTIVLETIDGHQKK